MKSTICNTDGSSELGGGDGVVTSLLTMLLTGGSRSGRFRQVFILVIFVNCYDVACLVVCFTDLSPLC